MPPAVYGSLFRISVALLAGALVSAVLYLWLRQGEIARQARENALLSVSARDEIAAKISHEIRTPLSGILGVMHLLRRTQLDRGQERYVDTATNSANMLLAIINDVIAHARMDTNWLPVESERFDLAEVVEDVASILAPEAFNKKIEMVCDLDPRTPARIKGDALRLRQVLNNFLINAIKYTDRGVVSIYSVCTDSGIEIGVRDTGVGMSPQQRELLLQPFSNMDDSYHRKEGAAGIGIKISRRLIKAMGSELQIESRPGEGSRFFFELALDDEYREGRDWNPPAAMRELGIGVVSPIELRRNSIVNMLGFWNIENVQSVDFDVETGAEPPQMEPCDVLIVDQTGTQQAVNDFIERLRNRSEWRDTRFVHLQPQNRDSDSGSADVRLHKPLSNSRLYAMLMDVIYKQAFSAEYEPRQGDRAGADASAPGVLGGRRILLVEDNDINKMIVLEMLEETGVSVDVAVNGVEALMQVQQQHYDLILMDIQMPVMDGYEATRQIRSRGGWLERIPIVAMTAHALEGDSGKSYQAGLDYHVTKPFEPDELIGVVTRFIEERGGRD